MFIVLYYFIPIISVLPVMIPILDGPACFFIKWTHLSFMSNNLIRYIRHGKVDVIPLTILLYTNTTNKMRKKPIDGFKGIEYPEIPILKSE